MTALNVEIDNLSGKLIYKYHFAGLRRDFQISDNDIYIYIYDNGCATQIKYIMNTFQD